MKNNIEQTAENLFDKLRNRFSPIEIKNEKQESTLDPKEARYFIFDYIDTNSNKNFGNITISIIGNDLEFVYAKDITALMNDQEKDQWYKFLKNIRFFAMRELGANSGGGTFDVRDISKSGLNLKDLKHLSNKSGKISKDDVSVSESKLYGTKKSSYQKLDDVKIIARHNKPILDDSIHGIRSRNIESFFIENNQGERFKLPEGTSLNGARAYARHVKNGGQLFDDFGLHIGNIVQEMNDLKVFVRNMRGKTFEDFSTQRMVETAIDHYGKLHSDLYTLRNQKGYEQYKSLWSPEVLEEQSVDLNELKERFVKKIFDDRLTNALPIIYREYNKKKTATEQEFESWANGFIAEYADNPIDEKNKKNITDSEDIEEDEIGVNVKGPFSNSLRTAQRDSAENAIDGNKNNQSLAGLLNDQGFEFRFQDGVYYFESKAEIERAKDWIAYKFPKMKFPKMGVFDYGYGVHGSTTFDRELPGGKGVMESSDIAENLRKWFKEKWVRFGPDGKIRGQCARDDDSEGKPKCLPQSKAHALGKKGRASAAARKRRKDPNPERSGSAINVKTKESIDLKKESKITDVGVTADQLNIGDEVIVTGKVKFSGATGRIADFGRDKAFVVVDLYNHGKHSFHSSDVEENLYAGSEEEEEELYHRDSDYRKLRDFDEQDVAEGNLTEIGFASALDDENYQPEELLKIGKDVGSIEGNQVMMARSGSEKAYFLVVDGKVTSFLGFKNGKLKNIKNFTNSAGVIRALVGFLVHKMQQKIIISSDESLTQDGLNWVMRLVKSPRGLKITDQTGNSIDVEFLKKEWITARETGSSGPTGIIIGENTEFGTKVRINEAALEEKTLLMPLKFYKIEHMELRMKKKQIVSEAKSLLKRVRVVQGPHKGKLGMIRQIKHGMFKGAPKAYFIDLDDGGQADNLPATALRLVRDERGVAENKEELTSLKAKANEISDKIDAIVKKGGRVGLNDPLSQQLKAIRAKIQKAKKKDISENSDYFRRRKGEEDIISGKKPGRKRAPTQTSDYARRREQEKAKEQGVAENRFDEPLSGYRIVYRKSGYPVTNTPRFETREAAQKYLMTKMSANHQNYQVTQFAEVAEASFTAAAALHAATRKQSGGKTAQPTHGIKVGDEITTADGKKGQVHFVQGDTVHVKGTNPYFPDKIKQYSASDLKKGMTEAAVGQSIDYAVWSQKSPRDQSRLMKDYPKLKILNKPSEPSAPKVQPKKLTLDDVWRKVESVVAQVYPDADPIDWLTPWFQKHGIRDFKIGEILDRAARKNGYKDLYDYYHSMSELYPGQQGVAEGANIQIPTKDGITWQDIRLMAGEGKLTKKTVLQAIAVIRKQRREQGVAEAKSKSATSNEDIVRWEVRMGDGTVKSFTDLLAAQKLFKQAQKGKYGKFAELVPVKKQDVQALDAYLSGIFKKHGAGKMKKGVSEAAESLTGVKLYNAIAGIMRANPALKFSSKESDAGSFKAWYQRINKVDVPALVAQLKAIDASVVLEKGQPWSIQGQNFRVEGPDLDYRGDSGLFLEVYRTGPGGALRRAGSDEPVSEAQDACYHKVKSRYKVWPSAYASGALVQCRKKGAKNWGNKSTNESKLEELISSFKSNLDDI